jgi:hypothetical protein
VILQELTGGGTYVALLPIEPTTTLLKGWADKCGVILRDDLHLTVLYSRVPVNVTCQKDEHFATPLAFDIFDGKLVLRLLSRTIEKRHAELRAVGGTHDFTDFNMHITLSDHPPVSKLPIPNFTLIFGNEYSEPLDLDHP